MVGCLRPGMLFNADELAWKREMRQSLAERFI